MIRAIIILVLLSPLAVAAIPNPSGPSVDAIAGTMNHATLRVDFVADPETNHTYDVTFTNVTTSATAAVQLYTPNDTPYGAPRSLYADGAHPYGYNATMPSLVFDRPGEWTLRDGLNNVLGTFHVTAAPAAPLPELPALALVGVGLAAALAVVVARRR